MQEISKGRLWTSYALSAIPVLLLLMAVAFDLLKTEMAVKGAADLGYPENTVRMLGGFALVTVVLYLIPRTSVLGAIFVACYFGGAVATHIRAGQGDWYGASCHVGLRARLDRLVLARAAVGLVGPDAQISSTAYPMALELGVALLVRL
jgi:hypothetical protein